MAYMALATLQQARHAFFDRHELPVGQVSDTILKSWIRCAESGLNPSSVPDRDIDPVSATELRQRHDAFRAVCAPQIEALYSAARDMDGIIVLSEENGLILDVVGDNSFAGRIKSPSLTPGMDWSERVRGTNGIGTALVEKRAISINGGEHFLNAFGLFSCAGMPVLDVQGNILGAVNLTTPASLSGGGALGMVRMTVEQIEHQLALKSFKGCVRLRFHAHSEFIGTAREGILIIRDGKVVGSNRNGLAMIGHQWSDLGNLCYDTLFEPSGDREDRLLSPAGREYACVWERDSVISLPSGTHSLAEMEETVMRRVLDAHDGNISAAARHLGVHRSTLYRRLKDA